MILDHLRNWRKNYDIRLLRQALELLESTAVQWLPDGRHELLGRRIIAITQGYLTKPVNEGRWEAHRQYIDIQYVVSGREAIGYAPITTVYPDVAYDELNDVAFYPASGPLLPVEAGMFAVFFPQDIHMPQIRVGADAEQVRKIVMKVAVE